MSGRLGSLPTSRNTQNCSKNYRMLRNSSQRLDYELNIVNLWSQTLYTIPPSVWQKSAQKQRDYFERMVLSCTVVAQWPDKGAEMGQFGRRSHIWCTHHQCHIFGTHPSAIYRAHPSAISCAHPSAISCAHPSAIGGAQTSAITKRHHYQTSNAPQHTTICGAISASQQLS